MQHLDFKTIFHNVLLQTGSSQSNNLRDFQSPDPLIRCLIILKCHTDHYLPERSGAETSFTCCFVLKQKTKTKKDKWLKETAHLFWKCLQVDRKSSRLRWRVFKTWICNSSTHVTNDLERTIEKKTKIKLEEWSSNPSVSPDVRPLRPPSWRRSLFIARLRQLTEAFISAAIFKSQWNIMSAAYTLKIETWGRKGLNIITHNIYLDILIKIK